MPAMRFFWCIIRQIMMISCFRVCSLDMADPGW
jgi:hypothetical protein